MYFKNDSVVESDLVLIHIENQPAFYGRVESIKPDVKPKWWQVKFLFLTLPHKVTTWIIDDEQIRGADFTMGGTPIRIEKLVLPPEPDAADDEPGEEQGEVSEARHRRARVLSMGDKTRK